MGCWPGITVQKLPTPTPMRGPAPSPPADPHPEQQMGLGEGGELHSQLPGIPPGSPLEEAVEKSVEFRD